MRWLDSVRFDPAVATTLMVFRVNEVYAKFGYECWITSGKDSKHKEGSKHYVGQAFDFRIKNVPVSQWVALHETIKACLGPAFDCILEADHIHIEYDPKS